MNFERSKTEIVLFNEVLEFATANLNNDLVELDHDSAFPTDKWSSCAAFGVLGWATSKELGGAGHSVGTTTYLMEALGQGCEDNGLAFGLGAQMWSVQKLLSTFGTEAQINQYLPKLLQGESHAGFAITETGSGSDAFALNTTATLDGSHYVLNGHKCMITMAPIADFFIVFASTNPEAKQWGLSAFLVNADNPGCTVHNNNPKMGLRSIPFGEIDFTNCKVPTSALIGKVGAGASLFNFSQSWERSLVLAPQVGAMQRILNLCTTFCNQRERFGSPIGKQQAVSHRIANIRMRLETSRLLLYKTAWALEQNQQCTLEAAITKTHISEAFTQTCHDAIAIHGGAGYISENGIERQLRDAIGATLYGGTVDMQRNIIARLQGV